MSLPPVLLLPLIVIGLLLAFFGRVIFYFLLFVLGGIVIGRGLALLFSASGHSSTDVFLVGLGGFFGGGLFAILVFNAVLFLMGALAGFIFGYATFLNSPYVGLIFAIVGGIALVILYNVALPVLTAIQGGSLIGLCMLLSGTDSGSATVVSILIAIMGAAFQLLGPMKNMRQRGQSLRRKRGR